MEREKEISCLYQGSRSYYCKRLQRAITSLPVLPLNPPARIFYHIQTSRQRNPKGGLGKLDRKGSDARKVRVEEKET